MDRDSLELLLQQGWSVARIAQRFERHPSTVEYWLRKHGLEAVGRDRHSGRGGLERERLEALVAEGLSVRGIATRTELSPTAVRHWLRKYDLTTRAKERREEAREAKRAGKIILRRSCRRHGDTDFWLEASGYYRCLRCRWERIARRRRRLKATLVEEAGGRCRLCGYQRYAGALGFHHVDPATKAFSIAEAGATISIARLRAEAEKCVLLCANCHAEVEAGIASVVAGNDNL
jgi:transposase